ncbi:conserved protein of unknown function [Streptococcus thermophilus]|uniref:Uncharacterized protein n=1 Tax=Streptococcus thermophilus TaxID=1308 RepID=A0A7U7H1B9_STRTR|nr:conserved protein of unknown function [Streptococcus thermophilus]CAD0143824.1 conserved protein of unknown function [Streptococcus thermophilus]CAD0148174.1 conserved protein of unknown function [Streptococcus thermophilus]CAD0149559.1 conserved protein of unknown function [Streptococcus thermophilus]CAD0151646.1 conserved protein of unknown function [Streptococcus thermophilus]
MLECRECACLSRPFSVSFTALVVVNNYKNLKGMVNAKKKRRNLWLIFGLISGVTLSG